MHGRASGQVAQGQNNLIARPFFRRMEPAQALCMSLDFPSSPAVYAIMSADWVLI